MWDVIVLIATVLASFAMGCMVGYERGIQSPRRNYRRTP